MDVPRDDRLLPAETMAVPTGFEPVTSAFGGQRSIQLSYGTAERRGPYGGMKAGTSRRYGNYRRCNRTFLGFVRRAKPGSPNQMKKYRRAHHAPPGFLIWNLILLCLGERCASNRSRGNELGMIFDNGIEVHLVTQDRHGLLDAIVAEQSFRTGHCAESELLVARRSAGAEVEERVEFLTGAVAFDDLSYSYTLPKTNGSPFISMAWSSGENEEKSPLWPTVMMWKGHRSCAGIRCFCMIDLCVPLPLSARVLR